MHTCAGRDSTQEIPKGIGDTEVTNMIAIRFTRLDIDNGFQAQRTACSGGGWLSV